MALGSRHYKILEAIRDTIVAESDIVAVVPADQWRVQKKPWHRTQSWDNGGTIAPIRRQSPTHENKILRYVMPCIVAIAFPSNGGLRNAQESRMALLERIENLFAFQGKTTSAAPMVALDSAFADENKFVFEQTRIDPGEMFIDGALQAGLDAMAVVVNVDITAAKQDYSSLGV